MSDKPICPFCGQEFREIYFNGVGVGYICPNPNCKPTEHFKGNEELWEVLIETKKKLDRAIWWLNEIVENHRFTPISTAEKALKELKEEK